MSVNIVQADGSLRNVSKTTIYSGAREDWNKLDNEKKSGYGTVALTGDNVYNYDSENDALEPVVPLDTKADSSTTSLAKENQMTLGYSAKNLLKVTATSGTLNGISYTVNGDGSVFIAGGQIASGSAIIRLNNDVALEKNGNYKFNGATSNTRSARLDLTSNVDGAESWENYGEEIDIIGNQTTSFRCSIIIGDGYTIPSGGLLFQPMIRDANITDDTFVPYQGEDVDTRLTAEEDRSVVFEETLGYSRKNLLNESLLEAGAISTSSGMKLNGDTYINTYTRLSQAIPLKAGTYIITSEYFVNGIEIYQYTAQEIVAENYVKRLQGDVASGDSFTINEDMYIAFNAPFAYKLSTKTMIRPASITDDTFVPYQGDSVDYRLKEMDDYNLLEIAAESGTSNGISYTVDKQAGTVFIAGGQTASDYVFIDIADNLSFDDNIILNGCPKDGDWSSTYSLIATNSAGSVKYGVDSGEGTTVTTLNDIRIIIKISNGYTIPSGGLLFKPMITKAEYKDMPFKPHKTPILRGTIDSVDAYLNYDSDIVGVEVDMEAKTVTRIAGAVGKSAGSDFDSINAFGGRKRCNLADDGTVNAYYGGSGYAEDGSNGQVMVEQPKFYYKVVPLKVDKASGKGWILRKARYYVSDKPREGFKIHPEFVRSGKVKEKVYHSAFEGCLYDTSESAYITDDAQVADFSADKLSSIANAKPMSGKTQDLTRANTRKLAENRGLGWEQLTIQVASATQLLMLIEYATFNMQQALSEGNSTKADDGSSNLAENTGATSSLGNASGEVTNSNGIKMLTYRGEEDVYANIWKWMDGLNKYDQTVYIADHNFVDDTENGYTDAGITACNANGFIKAFCYSEDFDWLFVPGEIGGDSALPVGDYYWYNPGWRVAGLGGGWNSGAYDGAFYLALDSTSSNRGRKIGGRLVYIPDTDKSSDKALTNEELTNNMVKKYNMSYVEGKNISIMPPDPAYIDDNSSSLNNDEYGFPAWYVLHGNYVIGNMPYAEVAEKIDGARYVLNCTEDDDGEYSNFKNQTATLRCLFGELFMVIQDDSEFFIGIQQNRKYTEVFKTSGFTATVTSTNNNIRASLSNAAADEIPLEVRIIGG